MYKPLIKICGVQSTALAKQIAQSGVHFIGLVFHPQSRRYVSLDQAKRIAETTKENGATPVAIFVDQNAIEMEKICEYTSIQLIQLHGNKARLHHHLLANHYQRIIAVTQDDNLDFQHCNPDRDFLLFDNIEPGSGKPFNWQKFNYNGNFRFGLAGGLTHQNVSLAIKQFKPAFVDVSSNVEDATGNKDLTIIKKFIEATLFT